MSIMESLDEVLMGSVGEGRRSMAGTFAKHSHQTMAEWEEVIREMEDDIVDGYDGEEVESVIRAKAQTEITKAIVDMI